MESRRLAAVAAATAFLGTLTSGPLGLWLVTVAHPQPAWRDAETFARAYHPIQGLPYFCGFLLVGGMVALIAGLHALAGAEHRARTGFALALAGAFAAMIFANYAVQTTLVPMLARPWVPSNEAVLAALTMANPRSLGWALEMWGYAVLGAATWLSAPVLAHQSVRPQLGRLAAALFVVNGPVSIATGFLTALLPGWVLTPAGLAAFATWNLIVLAMTLLAALAMRDARNVA